VSRGEVLDVPTLDERLDPRDIFDIDLTLLDPIIYSRKYHSLGKLLGEIGDFAKDSHS